MHQTILEVRECYPGPSRLIEIWPAEGDDEIATINPGDGHSEQDRILAGDLVARFNAFHDDQGRTLENIPQGLVWRLVDALDAVTRTELPERDSAVWREVTREMKRIARGVLDSLHIKEPK